LARVLILAFLLPVSSLRAEGEDIRHSPPDCVLAGEHAKLTACFDSVVARSRLVFRGGGISNYYRIDMTPDDLQHGCVNGFLPKLKRRDARTAAGNAVVQYYIESTRSDLMSARTKLADLKVVASAAECKGTTAPSVPEADVDPMPVDPRNPPYAQAAPGSYWDAGAGDERTTETVDASASATPVPEKKGGGSIGKTLLLTAALTGAAVAAAVAIGPNPGGGGDGGGGGGGGGNGGFCSATSQCASVGTGCSGGSANVRCASDGLCHCCYDVNGRCQSCSASAPCIDRNTSCVTGVCVFNQGARP
jgi:hypothetical protein